MRNVVIGSLMVLALALAISCQTSEPGAETADADAGEWLIEVVAADVSWSSGLALDSEGRPHIAYTANVNGMVGARGTPKYAFLAGGKWESVTVDADPDYVGLCHSIFIDDRDRVEVFYHWRGFRYARRIGSAWETGVVDIPDGVGRYHSVAVDSRGRPHIFYLYRYKGEIKYGRATADGWILETLDSEGDTRTPSLALDAEDRPHLLYRQYVLKYAHWAGTAWDVQTVDPYGDTHSGRAITVDSRGRPHIAYQDTLRRDLKYGVLVDGRWQIETVDTEGAVGTGAAIALDARDLPYISYYGENALKFAHYTGDGWCVQTLDVEAGEPIDGRYDDWDTSLALDARGRPHILYVDRCKDELKYAVWGGGEWEAQPAAGALVRWHPGLPLLKPGEPWRPVVSLYNHGLLYDKPFSDDSGHEVRDLRVLEIEANRTDAAVVGRLEKPTEVEIKAARSVYTLLVRADEDPIGPRWGYYTWLKVKAEGVEGWAVLRGVHPDFVGPYDARTGSFPDVSMYPDFPPLALVRFEKRFSPLREGPAASFPRVKDVCRAREYADAGEVDAVVARFGNWLGISHGWLPADTPGLAFYYMTYAWRPYRGEEEVHFYFPIEGDVDHVIYSIDLNSLYRKSSLPREDPVMTVSAGGRAYDLAIDSLDVFNDPLSSRHYFEAVLPEAVKREEIEAVTFTVGTEPHRVKATFDPREAWAEGAVTVEGPGLSSVAAFDGFSKIMAGMSYEEVVAVFGCEGALESTIGALPGSHELKKYRWHDDEGGWVSVTFLDGRVFGCLQCYSP